MNPIMNKYWKPVAGVAGLLVLVMYSSGACRHKVGPGDAAAQGGAAIPVNAVRYTVTNEMLRPRVEVVGTLASAEKITLSARISADVREVNVTAGSAVRKGDTLIVLDDREIAEQVSASAAQLAQAEKEFQRAKQLLDVKATTEQMFTAAEAGYKAAEARAAQARVMLTYARIVSPIDGIVIERRVEPGDLAGPGQPLATVYDPLRLRIEAPVPVRLARKLAVGATLELRIESESMMRTGRVAQIVGEINPTSRTQLVKVDLPGDSAGVVPGLFGRLFLEDDARPALLIPASAVRRVGQLETVQVVSGGNAIDRLVKTGEVRGDRVDVLSGLSAGEVILKAGGMERL